ncbi:unnamed protein product [Eruca vesicaria subsp. sativa]|uniref:LNK2 n=1 Tax=Eruca vesicaria subsp. sativa TaxID=29727 RepID=A0ABC8LGM1_ERUVS|nr:unnamed protein product [Eruca vesicaria subsp. sativa]
MIWGDDGETGDHIVPLRVRSEQLNRKELSNESNKAVKPSEQTKIQHNVDERISKQDFCMSSWLGSSLSNAREADPGSSVTELSKCLAKPARYSSKTGEKTSELWKGPDIFHSTDESKEQGDFDEYGWANIGSFDDLDRMFSNDVPIFGDGRSLSGGDELWSSSKDVSNSPSKPSVLDSEDLGLDFRTVSEQQENQQFPLTGKANDLSSQSVPSVGVTPKFEQYHEHKCQPSVEDQTYQQTKIMKFSETSGTSEAGAFHDSYGPRTLSKTSPGKFVNQLAINLQSESQGSGTPHYPHMPNQYMATSGFGNHTNPYSTVPVISAVQISDVKNQMMHPSYNPASAISLNMVTDASARPSTMTPQEKLEKLRRRQQMQAMLAIQRQQLRHQVQVPLADQYITQNCCQDNPLQLVDKANLQGLTAMPSFDTSSSLEPGDSDNFAAAAAVDNPSEFSVLFRLQDVVAKLDMGTRTCIRDSLFRLAESAGQRHHASDKTSQDDQEVTPKEKSRYRYGGMLDTETVTNPTDRTVAHLLFHRSFDKSASKHMEGPESPAFSKMGTEEKGKFPKCSTRESDINKPKAKEEDMHAGSLALGNAPNSGSSSTVAFYLKPL